LVTGATQERRILTGSALCAALAPKSAAAATLANISFKMRMKFLLVTVLSAFGRFWRNVAEPQ
jgi:hypothetical protein